MSDNKKPFSWEDVPESELKPYPPYHPEKNRTELHFAAMVRGFIIGVRFGEAAAVLELPLMINSLQEVVKPGIGNGFGTWNTRIAIVLGADRCRQIGAEVCDDEGFTLEDAFSFQAHYSQYIRPDAPDAGGDFPPD